MRPTFKELFELLSNEDYFLPNVREDDIENYFDQQKELIADTQQKLSEEMTKNQEYDKKVEE